MQNRNKSKFTTGRSYADNFFMPQHPLAGQVSTSLRLHDHTQWDKPHPARLFWTSEQPNAENSTWQHTI